MSADGLGVLSLFADRGSFSTSLAWLDDPPARGDLTFTQLCDLLRLMLAGHPVPHYTDPQDLLSDLHLVAANAVRQQERRAEFAEAAGASARTASGAAWGLVYGAGKRLTLRTADVRAALESGAA